MSTESTPPPIAVPVICTTSHNAQNRESEQHLGFLTSAPLPNDDTTEARARGNIRIGHSPTWLGARIYRVVDPATWTEKIMCDCAAAAKSEHDMAVRACCTAVGNPGKKSDEFVVAMAARAREADRVAHAAHSLASILRHGGMILGEEAYDCCGRHIETIQRGAPCLSAPGEVRPEAFLTPVRPGSPSEQTLLYVRCMETTADLGEVERTGETGTTIVRWTGAIYGTPLPGGEVRVVQRDYFTSREAAFRWVAESTGRACAK